MYIRAHRVGSWTVGFRCETTIPNPSNIRQDQSRAGARVLAMTPGYMLAQGEVWRQVWAQGKKALQRRW